MSMAPVIFAVALALDVAAFFVMRHVAARACGARGGRFTVGLVSRSRHLIMQRLIVAAAGPLGCYIVSGTLLAVGMAIGGKASVDEVSMRVTVSPGSPAARGGLLDGDRVVSVNGEPSTDWDRLKGQVHRHSGEPIDVEVERAGQRLVLSPTPGKDGKIGVGPPYERRAVGFGEIVAEAVVGPARVIESVASGIARTLSGRERPELTGPIGIVKAAGAFTLGPMLQFTGMVSAYYLWIPVLFGLALFPWPMRDRGLGVERADRRS